MIASIILVLYFLHLIPLDVAVGCLYISGILLLIAEFSIISLGILSVNAVLAFYAVFALQTNNTMFMGVDVGWGLLFGIAFVEFALLFVGIWLWRKHKSLKILTGTDAMIGQKALVVEWKGKSGKIQYEGEIWKAESVREMDLNPQENVTIQSIDKLTLIVSA